MTETRRRGWRTAAALALLVAVGGCTASGGGEASSVSGGAGQDAAAPGAAPPGAKQEAPGQTGVAAPARVRPEDRSIIYTGGITVRVDRVDEKADQAVAEATRAGGFFGSDKRTSDGADARATVVLRVPAARFGAVLDALAELGTEEQRDIDTEDVTEALVDLDARLASQQASVNRTRALLAQARTIGEIVSVESELAKREAELASLQARKRRMADLTALSTITVTLLGPKAQQPDAGSGTGFLAGLHAGWTALLASATLLLTVLGALLPWLLALALPIGTAGWLLRRLSRRRAPTDA